nr:uncharacterized protein LOC113816256 [Penaeus vannamei]
MASARVLGQAEERPPEPDKKASLHKRGLHADLQAEVAPAPSIWTPSVPRSLPSPRPANLLEQEERGRGTFVISLVALSSRQRHPARQTKLQGTPARNQQEQPGLDTKGERFSLWFSTSPRRALQTASSCGMETARKDSAENAPLHGQRMVNGLEGSRDGNHNSIDYDE